MDERIQMQINLAPVLYILKQLGKVDKHRLFKILYFADKDHIARFGQSITGESYIAMANGPVPSRTFDYIKIIEGTSVSPISKEFEAEMQKNLKTEKPYWLSSGSEFSKEFISVSGLQSLDKSLKLYGDKSFNELTELSHDNAWKATECNTEMSILDIAKDAGANPEMLKYIENTL